MNLVNKELLCSSGSRGKQQKLIQGFKSVKATKHFIQNILKNTQTHMEG